MMASSLRAAKPMAAMVKGLVLPGGVSEATAEVVGTATVPGVALAAGILGVMGAESGTVGAVPSPSLFL